VRERYEDRESRPNSGPDGIGIAVLALVDDNDDAPENKGTAGSIGSPVPPNDWD
jgi:hypothetical protein